MLINHLVIPAMRRCFSIFLLGFLPALMLGQQVRFDLLSANTLWVRNDNSYSTRIIVFHADRVLFDRVLHPLETSTFAYQYSRSGVREIRYKAVYDDRAFEADLRRLQAAKQARDNRRFEDAIWKAIATAIDHAYFGGRFSVLFEVGRYGEMLFNGATEEEWAEALMDSAIGEGIGQAFDNQYQRGLAAGAFEFARSIEPREYEDLQDWLVYFMRTRESKSVTEGYVTQTASLPRKAGTKYPYVAISAAYPINPKFAENGFREGGDFHAIKGSNVNDEYPFELRLNYKYSPAMGIILEHGRTSLFSNYSDPEFRYIDQNTAFRYTTYSLGINPSLDFVELGLGVSYMRQENYQIESATQQLTKTAATDKWGGFLEPRINIPIGNPITIFGSWRVTLYGDKELDDSLLQLYNFKAGIGINFRGRALDFSN